MQKFKIMTLPQKNALLLLCTWQPSPFNCFLSWQFAEQLAWLKSDSRGLDLQAVPLQQNPLELSLPLRQQLWAPQGSSAEPPAEQHSPGHQQDTASMRGISLSTSPTTDPVHTSFQPLRGAGPGQVAKSAAGGAAAAGQTGCPLRPTPALVSNTEL